MTGPVLAFDISATKGGTLRPVTPKAPDPAVLLSAFAARLGTQAPARDLAEAGATTLDAMPAALADLGFAAQITRWDGTVPALVEGAEGALTLVVADLGETLLLHDPARGEVEADTETVQQGLTGRALIARASAPELARRHGKDSAAPHWFWGELTRHRRTIAEVALGSFVANLLAVAVALFALQVYDRVIPHQSVETLWVLAGGAVLALMLEAGLRIARARLMDGAGRRIDLRVQALLMRRLMGRQAGAGDRPAETFSAIRDFSTVRDFFTAATIGTLTDLPFLVLFLALVASIGGNIVWLLFAGGLLMVVPGVFLQRRLMRLTEATQGAGIRANRLLQEAVFEGDTIRTLRGEARMERIWGELTALTAQATSDSRRIASALTFWSQGVAQATYVATVVVGAFFVFSGQFTVGTIIAVGILTSRTLAPLTALASTMARWSQVKAALAALDAVVDAPQAEEADRTYLRRDSLSGRFCLREVQLAYDDDTTPALDLPALRLEPGQVTAVLGQNGSGKSTLLRMLAGLLPPTSGRVLVDGIGLDQLSPRDLRRSVGYLGQEVRLFAGTLRENLDPVGRIGSDMRLLEALDFAGLSEVVQRHPKGLDLEIRDGGAGLSVGQRQSIGWARLWLQDPEVCILDEPTAALDQTLEAAMIERLGPWLAQRSAVIATHRRPILALADRVLVLASGRLAVDGPRDEVLAHLSARRAG